MKDEFSLLIRVLLTSVGFTIHFYDGLISFVEEIPAAPLGFNIAGFTGANTLFFGRKAPSAEANESFLPIGSITDSFFYYFDRGIIFLTMFFAPDDSCFLIVFFSYYEILYLNLICSVSPPYSIYSGSNGLLVLYVIPYGSLIPFTSDPDYAPVIS